MDWMTRLMATWRMVPEGRAINDTANGPMERRIRSLAEAAALPAARPVALFRRGR